MASVAKWLRQWFVVPPFVGSIPIVRPQFSKKEQKKTVQSTVFFCDRHKLNWYYREGNDIPCEAQDMINP